MLLPNEIIRDLKRYSNLLNHIASFSRMHDESNFGLFLFVGWFCDGFFPPVCVGGFCSVKTNETFSSKYHFVGSRCYNI